MERVEQSGDGARSGADEVFAGGGEMGALIRAMDWSQTPIGPVGSWSPALRMMVRFLLANRFPLLLWWGPQYVSIYNDPYRPVLGAKHPWALGRPVSECWSEIWHILQPLIDTPFNGGPATWNDDIFLEINRHGFVEETHFTIAYSPVPDDTAPSGIGGVLATVHEISEKVVGERRVVALRDLGAHVGDAKTAEEACAIVARTLAAHGKDVPFVLLYLIDADGARARLAGAAGVEMAEHISPLTVDLRAARDLRWPLAEAIQTGAMQVVERLAERFATAAPRGPWSDPPDTAVVMPIPSNKAHEPAGVMVAGVSARLKFDEYYRDFLELVRTQVATAIANARAYEEERRRAEALAELDLAKTAFFSNISHEFRTPLTLMLGPVEDLLSAADGRLSPEGRAELAVVHRNGLRMQRLVNTLLDFARIEAGRIQATYEPVDLAALTAELASVFRSAIERAGLRLVVDCPPLPAPIYVDREMWEKIVLNLLSNALKFTFEGEIAVELRPGADGRTVELVVRDTGVGVPAAELPRLFERFHRVEGQRARTHEGTGIGLALVHELVKLHGGTIGVESRVGDGSAFTVTIPTGAAHLPPDRVGATRTLASTALGASPFVEEALRWLPGNRAGDGPAWPGDEAAASALLDDGAAMPGGDLDGARGARVLVADDNADLRDYVRRLLGQRYEVAAVADGEAALEAARARPFDLVLADVMMPGLDGFGLLQALRADERLKTIPVILLSARAGEEARVEGLAAGADDYLVKPFSANELLARVGARLELARARRESESDARFLAELSEIIRLARDGDGLLYDVARVVGDYLDVRRSFFIEIDTDNDRGLVRRDYCRGAESIAGAYRLSEYSAATGAEIAAGRTIVNDDSREDPRTAADYAATYGPRGERAYVAVPLLRAGRWDGTFWVSTDAPRRWQPREVALLEAAAERTWLAVEKLRLDAELRSSNERFRRAEAAAGGFAFESDLTTGVVTRSSNFAGVLGYAPDEIEPTAEGWRSLIHPDDLARSDARVAALLAGGATTYGDEFRVRHQRGHYVWVAEQGAVERDAAGHPLRLVGTTVDITARKQAEAERERLLAAEQAARAEAEAAVRVRDAFMSIAAHELKTPLTGLIGCIQVLQRRQTREASLNERDARMLQQVAEQAFRLNKLIEAVLDTGRIQAGRLEIERAPVDVAALVGRFAEEVRPTLDDRSLEVSLADEPLVVIGDELRLEQVLQNLVHNAVKYSPAGGAVRLRVEREDGQARVSVGDEGIGIPPAELDQLFQRYYRAGNAAALGINGMGIGLYVVREIVTLHGGAVTVESVEGAGSTFTVRLPLADDRTTARHQP
jgi:PAS domain S-box-containing protein